MSCAEGGTRTLTALRPPPPEDGITRRLGGRGFLVLLAALWGACAPILPGLERTGSLAPPPTAAPSASPARTHATLLWRAVASLRTPRSHLNAVALDGAIYVVGGLPHGASAGTTEFQRYDPAKDSWAQLPDLPDRTDHAMVAALGSRIFVFGGGFAEPSTRAFRFDIAARAWAPLASLPEPRAAGGAAAVGDRIYVVGGFDANRRLLPTAYVFEPIADVWRRIADLPTPREHLVVVAFRGRVCALGGHFGAADQTTTAECYDPATDGWSTLPPMPRRASDFAAGVLEDAIWTVGDDVQVFDGAHWWLGPPLGTPRFGLAAVVISRSVYAIGGASRRPAPDGIVERLDLP